VSGGYRLGVDLGGTKIAAVVIAPDGSVAWEQRTPTPRHDYDATLDAIRRLVGDGESAVGHACSVGIGMPGAMSPATGLVKNANSTWLNGRPLDRDLGRVLARPVRLANDANCLALSESADGAAAGQRVVFGAILGTGVGGGIVVAGTAITGANAIAGEWGHNPLPWPVADERPGPPCYCGRSGCIETFLSGPGLSADYQRRTGQALDGEAVVARTASDPVAGAALQAWLERLARALATVINVLDPDVIVVGGGLSRIDALYDAVPRLWAPWVFSDRIATRLVAARHGDASGVRGAARLWG
jgi:predicted NBD/HSP70 family sugar kinase